MTSSAKRLPRFRREREMIRPVQLTTRDKEIIRQVARFHFLRSTQILELTEGAKPQILRRLQMLYHHGWLERPRCQMDFYHRGGSQPIVYGLGSRGVALMRKQYEVPFSKMVWGRGGSDIGRVFLEHTLMVAEIQITMQRACRDQTGIARFVEGEELQSNGKQEPFRWSANYHQRRVGLAPDAVFALDFENEPPASSRLICCLEADRGTMPVTRRSPLLSSISRKLAAYVSIWKAGGFLHRFNSKRVVVLIVTTSVDRAKTINECIAKLPEGRGLFTCVSEAEFRADPKPYIERFRPC